LRNWAFAALKIEKYNEVVQATDILLALSPDDTKGRYRRGKARWKLCNLEGAATDFEHILSLDLADDDERKAATTALSHLERDQRKADKQMRAIMQKAVAKNVLVEGRDGENKSLSAKQAKDEPNQQERDPQPPVAAQHGVRKTSKPVQKSKSDAVDALTVEDARHIIQELHTLYQTPEIDQELNDLRRAADWELMPFLRRLRPAARKWAKPIAIKYGLDADAVNAKGEGEITEVIQKFLTDDQVRVKAKENYKLLLGEIFDD